MPLSISSASLMMLALVMEHSPLLSLVALLGAVRKEAVGIATVVITRLPIGSVISSRDMNEEC